VVGLVVALGERVVMARVSSSGGWVSSSGGWVSSSRGRVSSSVGRASSNGAG
jgi:hypothetical protein